VACPFASTLGLFASIGGAYTLLVQDRRYRWLTGGALALIALGWGGYFAFERTAAARIGLEVASVAWIVAAVLRVRWLMRERGVRPPLLDPATRLTRQVWTRIGSPWVLSAKVWLLAMMVMEWRGKADFTRVEYGLVVGLLLGLMVLRLRATARPRPFAALESIAAECAAPSCPLGFGRAAPVTVRRGDDDDAFPATRDPRDEVRHEPAVTR